MCLEHISTHSGAKKTLIAHCNFITLKNSSTWRQQSWKKQFHDLMFSMHRVSSGLRKKEWKKKNCWIFLKKVGEKGYQLPKVFFIDLSHEEW